MLLRGLPAAQAEAALLPGAQGQLAQRLSAGDDAVMLFALAALGHRLGEAGILELFAYKRETVLRRAQAGIEIGQRRPAALGGRRGEQRRAVFLQRDCGPRGLVDAQVALQQQQGRAGDQEQQQRVEQQPETEAARALVSSHGCPLPPA